MRMLRLILSHVQRNTGRAQLVVQSHFGLPPLPGDVVKPNPRYNREVRAELTDVTDRIAAADNENDPERYRASR